MTIAPLLNSNNELAIARVNGFEPSTLCLAIVKAAFHRYRSVALSIAPSPCLPIGF
jgi:hypothetical protein